MLNQKWAFLILALLVLTGCAGNRIRFKDWEKLPKEHYTIPPYARYLAGLKIALDPGHGGMAHLPGYKRGPTGKREAIMNLNVALYLKQFLEAAGAEVILTRTGDYYVSLRERVEIAEAAGADILISLHHNASENPQTNFAAVFYHQHPDSSPVSLDLARNIYFGLVEALHLPDLSEEGLLSDTYIYPSGFGLLRRARIPAVLLESSFYSNRKEEKRLMKKWYNRREAYGIFLGLARWAAGGWPSAELLEPQGISRDKRPTIVYRLNDGLWERHHRPDRPLLIFSESVKLELDGKIVPVRMNLAKRRFTARPDSALSNGPHVLRVRLQNMFKNHNFPQADTIIVAASTDSIAFRVPTDSLPADSRVLMPVRLTAFDADGEAVWEGTEVRLQARLGKVMPVRIRARSDSALFFYRPPDDSLGVDDIIAEADGHTDTLRLRLVPPGQTRAVSGLVIDDSTRKGLAEVQILQGDSVVAVTNELGGFFLLNPRVGETMWQFRLNGYHTERKTVVVDSVRSSLLTVRLKPVLNAVLHKAYLIIDPDVTSAADSSRERWPYVLAESLKRKLEWAGARVELVQWRPEWQSVRDKIRAINQLPEALYIKLVYEPLASDSVLVETTIYPANTEGEKLARSVHRAFEKFPRVRTTLLQNTDVPEVTNTNKTALQFLIRCASPAVANRDMPAIFAGLVWYFREAATQK
ncbi:MAG: N-acetylmuramoyl-L-alanine amidase [candidate division KSB1 bacterium]|nr:N-acetylmuramoyl-L-alanine amidase [candidate division KSB1 bacterium]